MDTVMPYRVQLGLFQMLAEFYCCPGQPKGMFLKTAQMNLPDHSTCLIFGSFRLNSPIQI